MNEIPSFHRFEYDKDNLLRELMEYTCEISEMTHTHTQTHLYVYI